MPDKMSWFKKIFKLPIYPFLFAAFPVFFLYAYNIEEVTFAAVLRPLVLAVAGTLIFFLLLKVIFRNWAKSALLTTASLVIFFSHGHIHNLIGSVNLNLWRFQLGTDNLLFGVWAILILSLFIFLLRTKCTFGKLTGFLNFVGIVLVIYTLVTSLPYEINRWFNSLKQSRETVTTAIADINYKPDIYYLIFDRYAGNSVLKDLYGYDNSDFTKYLEEKGFYVAYKALANYPRTLLSLSSSLNFDYLDSEKAKFTDQLKYHEVGRFLKENGYRYLHLGSWAGATTTSPIADVNFQVRDTYIDVDEFSLRLFESTALAPVVRKLFPQSAVFEFHAAHKIRALYQVARLKEIPASQPGPKFVFAHVLLPHDPYVLDSDCSDHKATKDMLADYLLQLSCTNQLLKETVEAILENSPQPPVIIIQGDEGPLNFSTLQPLKYPFKADQSYKQADVRSMQERSEILNSYYLPGVNQSKTLYPTISPVNTFRLIFNLYFGTDLKILPDRSYIFKDRGDLYDIESGFNFIDVTDKIRRSQK